MSSSTDQNRPLIRGFEHPVSLQVFEGPLDLLLFLIRKNEIEIYDIPIQRITEQYLQILRDLKHQQLELAGEFFVMAATLMQIKSRMLLPKDEQLPEEESSDADIDPRWELVQQLIEYKKFKEAAGNLGELMDEAQNILYRNYFSKHEQRVERPLMPTDPVSIWNVFNQVLRHLSEKIIIGQIHDETVTVSDRMESILVKLQTTSRFRFTELIQGPVSVSYIVATFLALLELTRLRKVVLEQSESFADIDCSARME